MLNPVSSSEAFRSRDAQGQPISPDIAKMRDWAAYVDMILRTAGFVAHDAVSGASYEAVAVSGLALSCTENLAAFSVTFPVPTFHGQPFSISTTHAITALAVSANGKTILNAPASLAAGEVIAWRFSSTRDKWFRSS